MPSGTYTWGGKYPFRLTASGLHEDTLRVRSNYGRKEQILNLVLPTLSITFASAKFQNLVGGGQENYPASRAYGPVHFNPPVVITGEQEIEKLTYIRGARRVEIGPKETVIEFPSWKELVIPRLRLSRKEPAEARIDVPDTPIEKEEPMRVTALQFADGRHIGGVRLEKRHPDWRPADQKQVYDLWLRVIDGITLRPLPEVKVDILHWDPKLPTPYGRGCFRLDNRLYTDGAGCLSQDGRPSGELEAFSVRMPGRRAVVRCLRPLAGQQVRFHVRLWPFAKDTIRYLWRREDSLDGVAELTGHPAEEILQMNRIRTPTRLRPGMRILLPCYAALYRLEPWDTLNQVARVFGYKDAKGLAEANGVRELAALDGGTDIKLPDWRFFVARDKDTFEQIDAMFGLPKGSSRPVGRVFHPDPRIPYPGETVAVPSALFAERLRRLG